jgi:hypothetical protein
LQPQDCNYKKWTEEIKSTLDRKDSSVRGMLSELTHRAAQHVESGRITPYILKHVCSGQYKKWSKRGANRPVIVLPCTDYIHT